MSEKDISTIKKEIDLIEEKLENIFVATADTRHEEIGSILNSINEKIGEYNDAVKDNNKQILSLKNVAKSGKFQTELTDLQNKLASVKEELFLMQNKEDIERFFNSVDQYEKNQDTVRCLEHIYQKMKEKIVQKFQDFTNNYFQLIQDYLKQINPSLGVMEISGTSTYSRTGREPAQCGFKVLYNNEDQSGSLSEGERQSIALAYFFALLEKSLDKDKILVFDDPITSFDAGKRKSTAELIYKTSTEFSQTFILTCDPLFREFCLKTDSTVRVFSIYHTAGSSAIHFVPRHIAKIHESFEDSLQSMSSLTGTPENVIIFGQKLRFCLETKIKEVYFGYSEDSLRCMLNTAAAQGGAKFQNLLSNKDEIIEIYNYCNTGGLAHYPKDGSTSWSELQAMVQRYFALGL